MNRLEVIDLYKEYEGIALLNGVNFHIDAGETLCLLGSSGSGKSTILRIIAGIETPDSGRVLWQGSDISAVPVYQRNFGLMFQDYALFPHLTVAENVAFGLRMHKYPRQVITQKVNEALERVNMTSFGSRRVTDLSGGEQQRIALARALAPDPPLLMLDEPLAALDRSLRVELQEELRYLLQQTGIPAIYVTHDQEEAAILGDCLALLHDGKIVQYGRTEEIYRYPGNRWVAEFLGMTGLLEGTVSLTDPLGVETECGLLYPQLLPNAALPRSGERVTLLVKPTRIEPEPGSISAGTITGTVTDIRFLGDHYRIEMHLYSGTRLKIVSSSPLPPGQEMTLSLRSQDLLLLPD